MRFRKPERRRQRSKKLIETDGTTQMMYFLFRLHHMKPFDIMRMGYGERQTLFAFMRYELDERIKENAPTKEGA